MVSIKTSLTTRLGAAQRVRRHQERRGHVRGFRSRWALDGAGIRLRPKAQMDPLLLRPLLQLHLRTAQIQSNSKFKNLQDPNTNMRGLK